MTSAPNAARALATGGPRSTLARSLLVATMSLVALAPNAAASRTGAIETPPAREQSYGVTLWDTSNGLPQGTVNDLVQTRDGALWIATFGGLLLFDGADFRTFDLDTLPDLPSIRVTSLAPDGPNGIWVGTQAGHVLRMRDGKVLESRAPLVPAGEIVELVPTKNGGLWLRTSNGRLVLVRGGDSVEVLGADTGGGYEDLVEDDAGRICAGAGRALHVFDPDGTSLRRLELPDFVESIAQFGADSYWIGTPRGLVAVRGDAIEPITFDPPFAGRVSSLLPEPDGCVWLGTGNGPRLAVPGEPGEPWTLRPPPPGVPGQFNVRTLVRDRQGNIWAGAFGQGIARIAPHRVQRYSGRWSDAIVTAIHGDGGDGAWIAVSCRGLIHVADGIERTWTASPLGPNGKPRCVVAVTRDTQGRTWAVMNDSALVEEGEEWRTVFTTDAVATPFCGVTTGLDGTLWLANSTGEIRSVAADGTDLGAIDVGLRPSAMLGDGDGSLWVGGSSRLLHVRGREIVEYGQAQGLARGDVRHLLRDDDGSLWIATYGGGLSRLANGRIQRISREQGLPDNSLTCVLDDGRGRLWISSNRGLIVGEKQRMRDYLDGASRDLDFVLLGPQAGMPEANFGYPAGFRAGDGTLWFGTIMGAVRVDPAEFPFNRTPPTVHVRSVVAEDQPLPFLDVVDVPAGTRRLVVQLTAYGQTNPGQIRYRSRLIGFDDRWVDAGAQPQISFTGLPPGNYTLEVLARNEEGVWSKTPATLALTIEPMWWQTASFRILAVLAIGGAALGLHRVRVGAIRRRSRVLLEATKGRAEAELRESRLREELAHVARVATAGELATSLAHEVNQPLAAIVANAQAGRRLLGRPEPDRREVDTILDEIAQQGRRASEVIRRLREFLSKHEEERRACDVNALLRDTLPLLRRELEEHSVRLELDLDASIPDVPIDPVQIQQVLVNLIKNACEALSSTPGERRIDVRTERWADGVRLTVRDNGPGLAPAIRDRVFQPYVTTKPAGMGLGLAICRTIVEAHAGSLACTAHEGPGAMFRVDLPGAGDRRPEASGDAIDGNSTASTHTGHAARTTLEGRPRSVSDPTPSDGKVSP